MTKEKKVKIWGNVNIFVGIFVPVLCLLFAFIELEWAGKIADKVENQEGAELSSLGVVLGAVVVFIFTLFSCGGYILFHAFVLAAGIILPRAYKRQQEKKARKWLVVGGIFKCLSTCISVFLCLLVIGWFSRVLYLIFALGCLILGVFDFILYKKGTLV